MSAATDGSSGIVALTEHLLGADVTQEHHADDPMALLREEPGSEAVLATEKSTIATIQQNDLPTDAQFDFESAFRFMTERRLQRRYRGVYKQYSFTAQVVTWIIVFYTLSVLATIAFGAKYTTTDAQSVTSDSMFYIIAVLFVIYIFVRVALLIRWLLYWAVIAFMLAYAITGEVASVLWLGDQDILTSTQKSLRFLVVIFLIVAECLTVLIYYFTHRVYPWMVLNNKFDTVKWWNVKRHSGQSNTITYMSWARRLYTTKRNAITYCGGLDDQQRPHGYGMWTDTSFHGERLTGQWAHGIPIGPYRSFEHGSGYCFVNIRIGYCHNRAETRPEQILFWPKHASEGSIYWGVASVECSVSGGFFTFLPAVRHLTPHNSTSDGAPQCAADCEPLLRSPTDSVHYTSHSSAARTEARPRRNTKRFESAKRLIYRESSIPSIDLVEPSSLSAVPEGKEALILLHGYNCSLNYAMNRLAQLLALGDFPTDIHPFVFSWPSGGALAYFQARDTGSQSEPTARAFRDFLRSLIDAGYTTIHIIAHSMGARIYFHALNLGLLEDIFHNENEGQTNNEHDQRRATLATLTFANPDYERNAFVKRGGTYDKSRRICRCITLYADNMDGALFYSEIFSKTSVFGPLNYSLGKRGHMIHRDLDDHGEEEEAILGGDIGSNWQANHRGTHLANHNLTPGEMDEAIALVNQRGQFEGVAAYAYNRRLTPEEESQPDAESSRRVKKRSHRRRKLGSPSMSMLETDKFEYLDMDVVDTTWMDNNVHAIRHNYFNLNPTVVEDIRCLVVEKQRAAQRPGLLKTNDNVYIFLVAPSHIKNK